MGQIPEVIEVRGHHLYDVAEYFRHRDRKYVNDVFEPDDYLQMLMAAPRRRPYSIDFRKRQLDLYGRLYEGDSHQVRLVRAHDSFCRFDCPNKQDSCERFSFSDRSQIFVSRFDTTRLYEAEEFREMIRSKPRYWALKFANIYLRGITLKIS